MGVQFGMAIMRLDSVTLGYMQGASLDFNFEQALLYAGNAIFPVDVRVHTGSISGSAEYADLNALGVHKLLGGTKSLYGAIALTNTSYPGTWQALLDLATDDVTFRITLNKCRSTKLSFAWARAGHIIPAFDFSAYADENDNVGTIVLEDVS
jgi:hypothetical protein